MLPSARRPLWRSMMLGALVLLWIGLSWLLAVSRGSPGTYLQARFEPFCRADAFSGLNQVSGPFWMAHSLVVLIAVAANWFRRSDVFVVLLIGPALALMIGVAGQRWDDPNWVVVVGVCLIGWLVSTLVGCVYWSVRPRGKST